VPRGAVVDGAAPVPIAGDAYVAWQSSRYSVPCRYAGKEVWVREQGRDVEVRCGAEVIARHKPALRPSGRHSRRAPRRHSARQPAGR